MRWQRTPVLRPCSLSGANEFSLLVLLYVHAIVILHCVSWENSDPDIVSLAHQIRGFLGVAGAFRILAPRVKFGQWLPKLFFALWIFMMTLGRILVCWLLALILEIMQL